MCSKRFRWRIFCLLAVLVGELSAGQQLLAQELVPRAFWPSPIGTNVFVLGYQRSQGDITVDPSLPISGVDSKNDFAQLSFQHTFNLWGRTATAQVSQAFAEGNTSGFVDGEPRARRTVGALDTSARFAINLSGAPAMDRSTFRERMRDPDPIIGASVSVSAPTGVYDSNRLINLGNNRWSVKPALGMIYPLTPSMLLETELGVWFFSDNDEFLGSRRSQDPVGNFQIHLVKRFGRGYWAALDANYYVGGRAQLDGGSDSDALRNSRLGATFVAPLAKGQALRLSVSTGMVNETGGDFDLFSIAWISVF